MSCASDVYAYGVLLFTLCIQLSAFHGSKASEIQRSIASGDRPILPEFIPSQLEHLIKNCMSPCACERPSFDIITKILEGEKSLPDTTLRVVTEFVASQMQLPCTIEKQDAHHSPLSAADAANQRTDENLVPGKRYACINFKPAIRPRRRSPTMPNLDHAAVRERRQVASRRCSIEGLNIEAVCVFVGQEAASRRSVSALPYRIPITKRLCGTSMN